MIYYLLIGIGCLAAGFVALVLLAIRREMINESDPFHEPKPLTTIARDQRARLA